jgi:peptidoglycan hydrolase-like protein with peptidoglycan-binding domain
MAGQNRKQDVLSIQQMLNQVPSPKGGPLPKIAVDGLIGPKTIGGIQRFQRTSFGWADGRIDPGGKTIQFLLKLLAAIGGNLPPVPGLPGNKPPEPPEPSAPPNSETGSLLRDKMLEIAISQARAPYGVVSDRESHYDLELRKTVRNGWKILKAYFEETVVGWTPTHWKVPGYLNGVQVPGARVPQPGTEGISWCGIFATWCAMKAGKQTKWMLGGGPTNMKRYSGDEGIQLGDICVEKGKRVHHFIPIKFDGENLITVNGNSGLQSILIKPKARSIVWYYYRLEE